MAEPVGELGPESGSGPRFEACMAALKQWRDNLVSKGELPFGGLKDAYLRTAVTRGRRDQKTVAGLLPAAYAHLAPVIVAAIGNADPLQGPSGSGPVRSPAVGSGPVRSPAVGSGPVRSPAVGSGPVRSLAVERAAVRPAAPANPAPRESCAGNDPGRAGVATGARSGRPGTVGGPIRPAGLERGTRGAGPAEDRGRGRGPSS